MHSMLPDLSLPGVGIYQDDNDDCDEALKVVPSWIYGFVTHIGHPAVVQSSMMGNLKGTHVLAMCDCGNLICRKTHSSHHCAKATF